jgi:hypothetical protein
MTPATRRMSPDGLENQGADRVRRHAGAAVRVPHALAQQKDILVRLRALERAVAHPRQGCAHTHK